MTNNTHSFNNIDHMNFLNEIDEFRVLPLKIKSDTHIFQKFQQSVIDSNLLLIGEIHGVKENPLIIYTLMKEFRFDCLCFEWNPRYKGLVDDFLNKKNLILTQLKVSMTAQSPRVILH
jgi:hypothetical protein